jgi:hypothetical protein
MAVAWVNTHTVEIPSRAGPVCQRAEKKEAYAMEADEWTPHVRCSQGRGARAREEVWAG